MTHRSGSWESIAGDFERHAADSAYNAWYDRPSILDLIGDVSGKRVLDVGCGPGFYARELVTRGADVVGFDESPTMVDLARARLGSEDMFRVHDLAEPVDWLEDASFDIVLMALVLHLLHDRVAALREIHRVLRAHGCLVISTHHPTGDWLRHGGSYFDVKAVEEVWSPGWQVRYWRAPLSVTCAEFTEAGFLIERLVEPLPDPGMAERYPDDYTKLTREPGFINFRLVKRQVPAKKSHRV